MIASRITRENPYDSASWLSKLFFVWIIPIFRVGYNKDIDHDDVYKVSKDDDPRTVADKLQINWNAEVNKGKSPSLARALVKTFGLSYCVTSIGLVLTECVLRVAQPFVVGVITRYVDENSDITPTMAWLSVAYLIASTAVFAFVRNNFNFLIMKLGRRCQSSVSVLIYRKLLRLSRSSFEFTSVGQILNMFANDLQSLEDIQYGMVYLFIAPVETIIVMILMWQYLGVATIGGIVILVLFVPFQGVLRHFYGKFKCQTTDITDKRVKLMSELISAMKLIKVYCWEQPFADVLASIRKSEVSCIRKKAVLDGLNVAMNFMGTRAMLFASFVVHVLMGNPLTPEVVFVTMALYNTLSLPVTAIFPYGISATSEALVGCRRIQRLLMLDERSPNTSIIGLPKGTVSLEKYCAKWSKNAKVESLKNITFGAKPDQLAIIVGSVGAGKTCLLNALLHEVEQTGGTCSLGGTTSYAPQEAWCFAGTVRDNILLGNEFDAVRYNEVVRVCGLKRDLELFPDSDQTKIGEKGYTLSGGQKARVTLARAVYNEADIYLLDDPLSAVDPAVAKHLFDKCIKGFLKDKTVILVTHQLQFLHQSDVIMLLNEGSTSAIGTYDQLMTSGIDFVSLLKLQPSKGNCDKRTESLLSNLSTELKPSDEEEFLAIQSALSPNKKDEEAMTTGSVSASVYWNYFRSGGSSFVITFVFSIMFVAQGIYHFTDFWLSDWTQKTSNAAFSRSNATANDTLANQSEGPTFESERSNLITYTGLMALLFVLAFIKTLSLLILCLRCSIKIHDTIFGKLLRAPMLFFENNPMGRILNRFTRDLGQIDLLIPFTLSNLTNFMVNSIGITVVSAIVSPYMIAPTLLLALMAYYMRRIYMRTARDLKRLDAVTKSPVYGHITSTVDGLTTVRAFGLEEQFKQQFFNYLNDSYACRILSTGAGRSLAFILDMFTVLYVSFVAIIIVAAHEGIPGGDAGLALSSSLLLTGIFQNSLRQTTEFENQMISVERVLEYGKLDTEFKPNVQTLKVPLHWPSQGSVEYRHAGLVIKGCPKPILSNLNFVIKGGEKIGVVGRTGAGKSSLITILFRLTDPEGSIFIDGLDTKSISLLELRRNISIIPQDPVLFSGTIRKNLDPFKEYDDTELWTCLRQANLDIAVNSMQGGLEGQITEGGSNLSVGQRQLLCLARALLRNNKILVLDEATANVDHETDELIQRTIRTQFVDCTVITVAHRLNTVIDMDKILVLDAGHLEEFDEPYTLLEQKGLFYEMVQLTGRQMANVLQESARQAQLQRYKDNLSTEFVDVNFH